MTKRYVRNITSKTVKKAIEEGKEMRKVLGWVAKPPSGVRTCKICLKKTDVKDMTRVTGSGYPYWMCDSHRIAGLSGLKEI